MGEFIKTKTRTYEVGGRNGYYAVDEYKGDSMTQCIISGVTKKVAQRVANSCAGAVHNYKRDNSKCSEPGSGFMAQVDASAVDWDQWICNEVALASFEVIHNNKAAHVHLMLRSDKSGQFKVVVRIADSRGLSEKNGGTIYMNTRGFDRDEMEVVA